MTPRDEDEVWREIVDNFGETPTFEDDRPREAPAREREPEPMPEPEPAPEPQPVYEPDPWEDEGRFVPPPPPPVPLAEPKRQLAWLGVFVAPLILLVSVVLGWAMPGLVTLLLVLWFVGGFLYLVGQMPPGPRDPGDNGARL